MSRDTNKTNRQPFMVPGTGIPNPSNIVVHQHRKNGTVLRAKLEVEGHEVPYIELCQWDVGLDVNFARDALRESYLAGIPVYQLFLDDRISFACHRDRGRSMVVVSCSGHGCLCWLHQPRR